MPPVRIALVALSTLLASGCAVQRPDLVYPASRTVPVVEELHGVSVADPYRWLERYEPDTNAWIAAQASFARRFLDSIPERRAVERRVERLWTFERYGIPVVEGGRRFYTYADGVRNQPVLMVEEADGRARVLLDPNTMRRDGTAALAGFWPDRSGRLLAYAMAEAGSDWNVIRVRDVATGRDLPDRIEWTKFTGAAWTADGGGFFYGRFPAPEGDRLAEVNEGQELRFHRIGTPQSEDRLVFRRPDKPRSYFDATVSDDGRWLVLLIGEADTLNNALFVKDLASHAPWEGPWIELLRDFDARYSFVGNDGDTLLVQTDRDAPLGRVVAIDVHRSRPDAWRTLVPEGENTLLGATIVGDRIFCNELKDARSRVSVRRLDGSFLGEVPIPDIATVAGFSGRRSDSATYFAISGYTLPPAIWRYDLANGTTSVFRAPSTPFDASPYETTQIFATSRDGTRVPMFVTRRRGAPLDGSQPLLLHGYGGFNVPLTPSFSAERAAWLELGGTYVEANLRGGGEYGDAWHRAGTRERKQNVFDDFIACAEHLIAQGYTATERLAIAGGSNGGLLVGACMTQRPELFGACLPAVGVLDMLRFQYFTIGWAWTGDYGSSENAEQFRALHAYSPYHAVRPGVCYPPTLITTGDHDDRVHPAHSFKFAAALQAAQSCDNPILIRIEERAGHGAGKPRSKRIAESADTLAFLVDVFRMPLPR